MYPWDVFESVQILNKSDDEQIDAKSILYPSGVAKIDEISQSPTDVRWSTRHIADDAVPCWVAFVKKNVFPTWLPRGDIAQIIEPV